VAVRQHRGSISNLDYKDKKMNILPFFDILFLILLPFIGFLVGWIVRHGRKVVDTRLTWEDPLHEQIEDAITLALAMLVGAVIMVLTGLVYVWWVNNYFVVAYQHGFAQFIQNQPIIAIGYWAVGYFISHSFAWIWRQQLPEKSDEDEKE